MKVLLVLFFMSMTVLGTAYANSNVEYKLTSEEFSNLKKSVKDIFEDAYKDSQLPGPIYNPETAKSSTGDEIEKEFNDFRPKDLFPEYYKLVKEIYIDGYIRKEHFDFWA